MMKYLALDNGKQWIVTLWLLACLPLCLTAAEPADTVVVVYNARMPESKQVADYYAAQRQVPAQQVFGFELPTGESMSRQEYLEQLEAPLLKKLTSAKLLEFGGVTNKDTVHNCVAAKVRYAVLCFGVPTKIAKDPKHVDPGEERMQVELRRNEASVDSQLACLPMVEQKPPWAGPLGNPHYGATNRTQMHPTNGLLMVTRLDGPTAAIARGLVDKAMEAETNGMWGRAYFDSRGITNGGYKMGDDWIRGAAEVCRRLGFETSLDENEATFPSHFPLSQVAVYAGWYDGHVSGPFAKSTVEFMPGAFAYHLHSFNANKLRTDKEGWVGPLLARGATITIGTVEEPYLSGTPDVATFCARLIYSGFTFGEAAYAAQSVVSWQAIAVGDPLYRPFGKHPQLLHADLETRKSPLVEWSHLRVANLNLAMGYAPTDAIQYLEQTSVIQGSALLNEKVGDVYWSSKRLSDAVEAYERALRLKPTPQQRLRVMMNLAQRVTYLGGNQRAYDLYQLVLKDYPDYGDRLGVLQKLQMVAQRLGHKDEAARLDEEIQRLKKAVSGKS